MAINTCAITGQIVEVSAPKGTEERLILDFKLNAVETFTSRYTGKQERRDNVLFVACYGDLALSMARKLAVGMNVTVQGRLKHSTWTNGRGTPCDAFTIAAQSIAIHQAEHAKPTFSGNEVVNGQDVGPDGFRYIRMAQEAVANAQYDLI